MRSILKQTREKQRFITEKKCYKDHLKVLDTLDKKHKAELADKDVEILKAQRKAKRAKLARRLFEKDRKWVVEFIKEKEPQIEQAIIWFANMRSEFDKFEVVDAKHKNSIDHKVVRLFNY